MAAVHKYRNDDGDLEEVPNVLRWGWSSQETAEEGSASSIQLFVDDPDLAYDFVTWRRWVIYESTSETMNEILFSGFITSFSIAHQGSDILNPTGRVWTISIADMNNLWDRRVLVGSDTDRPAETDVERMQWLVDTEEMGYFDDFSLLSTDDPVDLDARDTRGTTTKQVADECSQQSGKNYWIGTTGTIGEIGTDNFIWYGKDSLPAYASPLALSNDPGDLDMADVDAGTATTYPLGSDTVLDRTGDRIYDGTYVEYDGGAAYVKKPSTTVYFQLSGRDITTPAPEIKSATRAKARGARELNDLDTMIDRITTSPEIPASKATMIRAGMLITITATHLPSWEAPSVCRIISAQHSPIYGGSWYRVTIVAERLGIPLLVGSWTACNTVVEDSGRDIPTIAGTSDIPLIPGQTYTFRITQTQWDADAYTEEFQLSKAGGIGLPIDYYQFDAPPDAVIGPPYEMTGTFSVASTGITGDFHMHAKTNGYTTSIDPLIDDCWTVELWLGIVDPEDMD